MKFHSLRNSPNIMLPRSKSLNFHNLNPEIFFWERNVVFVYYYSNNLIYHSICPRKQTIFLKYRKQIGFCCFVDTDMCAMYFLRICAYLLYYLLQYRYRCFMSVTVYASNKISKIYIIFLFLCFVYLYR